MPSISFLLSSKNFASTFFPAVLNSFKRTLNWFSITAYTAATDTGLVLSTRYKEESTKFSATSKMATPCNSGMIVSAPFSTVVHLISGTELRIDWTFSLITSSSVNVPTSRWGAISTWILAVFTSTTSSCCLTAVSFVSIAFCCDSVFVCCLAVSKNCCCFSRLLLVASSSFLVSSIPIALIIWGS